MATHLPSHLLFTVFFLLVILLKEELGALHSIDVHKFISRLGHRKVVVSSLTEPLVEVSQLLVLFEDIVDVADLKTSRFCNLLLDFFRHFDLH